MKNFPCLGILTLLPLLGAIVVALIPRRNAQLAKQVAMRRCTAGGVCD